MAERRGELHQFRSVFSEDVVHHPSNVDKLGVVIDANEETDSEFSDSDEEKLQDGHVLVAWYPKGKEEEILEKRLRLVDRSLLPGDVVRWSSRTQQSQKGFIEHTQVSVDLKISGTQHTLKEINSLKLQPPFKFGEDALVVLDGWSGVVVDHMVRFVLRMKNGSRCVLEEDLAKQVVDCTDQRDEDSPFYFAGYYVGQEVSAHPRVFKDAKWISGSRPIFSNAASRAKAVVEEFTVVGVEVNWQYCGVSEVGDCNDPPDSEVKGERLERLVVLDHFKEASIQIGDKALYTLTEDDVQYIVQSDPMRLFETQATESKPEKEKQKEKKEAKKSTSQQMSSGTEESADDEDSNSDDNGRSGETTTVSSTRPRTDQRPSTSASQSRSHGARRRRHAQRRKKKPQLQVNVKADETVCIEVQRTSTIVSVLWQDAQVDRDIHSTRLCPVLFLDEHEFFPGDFVVDQRARDILEECSSFGCVISANAQERTCCVRWLLTSDDDIVSSTVENDISVYDIGDHPDFHFRPGDCVIHLCSSEQQEQAAAMTLNNGSQSAGQVVSVSSDGHVKVIWSNGNSSSVPPQQLFIISKDEDEGSDGDDSGSSHDSSDDWETASDDSMENDTVDLGLNPLEDIIMRSLAALPNTNLPPSETQSPNAIGDDVNTGQDAGDDVNITQDCLPSSSSVNHPAAENSLQPDEDNTENFEVVEAVPASHNFFRTTFEPLNPRHFLSVVRREMGLLSSSLPEGITVRSFEDRLDLLSVLIAGPIGTPYEDGLFAFDVQLPPDYPQSPPVFHYISYCSARLNPNLYENGKVCVSLLGTWSGKGTEKWTSKSNVLQVLLSIQGLILCEEPYYNEAGFEKHRGSLEGHDNSRLYNEMAIIKLLQSTESMIRNPPHVFRRECGEYFQTHGRRMISRWSCVLANNRPAECADFKLSADSPEEDSATIKYPLLPLSKGFFVSVARAMERLQKLLDSNQENVSSNTSLHGKL